MAARIWARMMKGMGMILVFALVVLAIGFVSGQEATVCCEQTTSGAFCQNVPSNECAPGSQQVPTSCESTSFCKAGTCFDSNEGTCMDNTPQLVCNANGGIWSEESPPQCQLGCCILGDQAAFVSLVRCKKLSGFLGLLTNYKSSITNELACIAEVQAQDKGACVFEFEFENSCKFTTRSDCSGISDSSFYKDKLCSAEELGTICGPTTETMLVAGKDEVYFKDTCGNAANIYDASKINDKEYWTNVKNKAESCNPNSANTLSAACGNCNYLLGSYGRDSDVAGKDATYGDYICANLNCGVVDGVERRHGESWCVNSDAGSVGNGENSVGSRFHKQICVNGEIVVEPCGDFRSEECVEDQIETVNGPFSQAACRVNRWQDCLAQGTKASCENTDKRDCSWNEKVFLGNQSAGGTCLPKNSPGLNFWSDPETTQICMQATTNCVVKYEKGAFDNWGCVENCHCLEEAWLQDHINACNAIGDCGNQVNWVGKKGYGDAFKKTIEKLKR